jgi:aromatic ring hydroxylase
MGRSPDHLASALVGQRIGLDVFARYDVARAKAFADYFDYASRSDLFLTYVIINPQADRSKDWGDQDDDLVARVVDEDASGITIRGAKMLGTSSIMANDVFVANLQPLRRARRTSRSAARCRWAPRACACCRASPTRRARPRCSTIRCRRGSTRTTR